MAAMVIVNTPGDWTAVYAPLLHAEWHGWTPTDLIFPFFVFIVGVSIVLSRRRDAGVATIARRAAVLFGLGLLLALYPRFDVATVRIMGVLQRLALCYLAAALFHRAVARHDETRRIATALIGAGTLLVTYWALLRFVAVPGGVAGDLTASGNLGAWLDRAVLGEAHLWRQSATWDPEGLLSTLPAIATALTGLAAGTLLLGAAIPARKVAWLALAGIGATILGSAWGVSFPINKNLWTSSYVLFTSGLASLLLALVYWAVDVRGWRGWTRPLVVMGTNALTLFVVSGLLVKTLLLIRVDAGSETGVTLYRAIHATAFEPVAPPKTASLLFALAALAVLYALLEALYRKRWFLRA